VVHKVSKVKRFKVKALCPGEFSAPALVTRERVSLLGNCDAERGLFIDPKSELKGASFAGKALIFTSGKGSTLWSFFLNSTRRFGTQPAAIINQEIDSLVVWACVLCDIPMFQVKDDSIFHTVKNDELVTFDPVKQEIVVS
jgi:predicted aconitase with swiveling domain